MNFNLNNNLFINYNCICFETTGSVTVGGKLLIDNDFCKYIIDTYNQIELLLVNKLLKTKKNIPYIVGGLDQDLKFINLNSNIINNKLYKYLLCSFPVKNKINELVNLELKKQSTLIIEDYSNSLNVKSIIITDGNYNTNNVIYSLI